ncbi:MAG: sensor histidine kinase [Candidatus Xenobia bacterium]
MHKLLERQLKRYVPQGDFSPAMEKLLGVVSDTYQHFEEHIVLTERSLELSSAELTEMNDKLSTEVEKVRVRTQELEVAQHELESFLSILRATLDSTADGILVVDNGGRVMTLNQRLTDLWQLPEEVLTAREKTRLLEWCAHQLVDPERFLHLMRLHDDSTQEAYEILTFRDGRVFECYSLPQRLHDRTVGRVWSFRDITARHRAEEQKSRLLKELEQANNELKDFAYIVSHDLKAPLRAIGSLAAWIVSDYGDKLDQDGLEQMALLVGRVKRMQGLIDGILQYSRVGRVRETLAQTDLNNLLQQILDSLSPPEQIEVKVQANMPTVSGEKTRIQQVFQNLISNAIKYMDKPAGRIDVGWQDRVDCWQFSIADNGPGIEERFFSKIFQIFQTLVPRDDMESTGIGLTIVKKVVELHGGQIWVESQMGQGTTFYFTLPKQPVMVDANAERKPELVGNGKGAV